MQRYLVAQDRNNGEILDGVPTPRLISFGGGLAYIKDGIVYMKDDGYESPDGSYRNVRVIRNPEYREMF